MGAMAGLAGVGMLGGAAASAYGAHQQEKAARQASKDQLKLGFAQMDNAGRQADNANSVLAGAEGNAESQLLQGAGNQLDAIYGNTGTGMDFYREGMGNAAGAISGGTNTALGDIYGGYGMGQRVAGAYGQDARRDLSGYGADAQSFLKQGNQAGQQRLEDSGRAGQMYLQQAAGRGEGTVRGAMDRLSQTPSALQALYSNPSSFQQDPGYQFRLAQGEQAINRSAAAQGGRLGGSTLKALDDYSQGMASQEFGNAVQRAQAVDAERMGINQANLGAAQFLGGQQFGVGAQQANAAMGTGAQRANLAASTAQGRANTAMGLGQGLAGSDMQTGSNLANLYAQGGTAAAGTGMQGASNLANIYGQSGAGMLGAFTGMGHDVSGIQGGLAGGLSSLNMNLGLGQSNNLMSAATGQLGQTGNMMNAIGLPTQYAGNTTGIIGNTLTQAGNLGMMYGMSNAASGGSMSDYNYGGEYRDQFGNTVGNYYGK